MSSNGCAGTAWSIVEMELTPTEVTIAHLMEADFVISVEGSQLSHAVYALAEGGLRFGLQPPFRFYNAHKDWADALGMHYGFVVGDMSGEGFTVDPDDIMRTIDLFPRASRCQGF